MEGELCLKSSTFLGIFRVERKIVFYFFCNWRKISLQCCVGFCHITTRISHSYTYIPCLMSLLPLPHPRKLFLNNIRIKNPLSPILGTLSFFSFFLSCVVVKSLILGAKMNVCKSQLCHLLVALNICIMYLCVGNSNEPTS